MNRKVLNGGEPHVKVVGNTKLRYVALTLLSLQQICLPLLSRFTRSHAKEENFFTTTTVFFTELVKLIVCFGFLLRHFKSFQRTVDEVHDVIFVDRLETAKICLPALIYTIQNNAYYVALTHLDAATFCVLYQLKILTTALLMRLILGRRLTVQQWVALTLLVIGAAQVELSGQGSDESRSSDVIGLLAVAIMCITSAIAGVYLESVLKRSPINIWLQNIRLCLVTLPISLMSLLYYESAEIQRDGFFHGWDTWVVLLAILSACTGLTISLVMKHADNILKAYAQSMGIIGSAIGSWLIFGQAPSALFALGASFVIGSLYIYSAFTNRSNPLKTLLPRNCA